MSDSYSSIASPVVARITRERSRFLALLFPLSHEEEIAVILERIRREYHDASHRASASRLFRRSDTWVRTDDAGEPRGTAGAPILRELEAAALFDVIAVVVRYFGGTKLGRGGLARAYGDAVKEAIALATRVEHRCDVKVALRFPVELSSGVMALVHRHAARVERIAYDAEGRMLVLLPASRVPGFSQELAEVTGARAQCEEES